MADQDLAHRVVSRFERQAASEIKLKDLPKPQQELVHHIGGKPAQVWGGIHGYVVDFDGGPGSGRFTKEFLHKVIGSSVFRWIEGDNQRGGFSVGM
jgi:hypothetical protein